MPGEKSKARRSTDVKKAEQKMKQDYGNLPGKIQLSSSLNCLHDVKPISIETRQFQHLSLCKQAQREYQKHHKLRALCSLRQSFLKRGADCKQCLGLLMRILNECPTMAQKAPDLIQICLNSKDLPMPMRAQFHLKFRSMTSPNFSQPHVQLHKFNTFLDIYRQRGAEADKIQLQEHHADYRVAVSKKLIKPYEVIIFVPENQIITLEIARGHPVVQKILPIEHRLKSPKHCILSLFLLCEKIKKENSRYWDYIESLPKNISNFPVKFDSEMLKELEGTNILPIINKKKEDLQDDFKIVGSFVNSDEEIFNYDDFIWARMIVSSRVFGSQIKGIKTDALVPIADMLNHKVPKTTIWFFSEQKNGFIVQNSNEKIEKNKQIFDSYGNKCNSRFFLNYGFVQANNFYNEVAVNIKKYANLDPPVIRLIQNVENQQFKKLILYYRNAIRTIKIDSNFDRIEQEAWIYIIQSLKTQLSNYSTSIKTDQRILSEEISSFNRRNCIEIRLGQKKILQFYIKMGKDLLKYFKKKAIALLTNEYSRYSSYLKELTEQKLSD